MISLKDYAKRNGVSYEAVRQQVNRYKKDLEGHITKQNKTQLLDDVAVAFLDEKRTTNPVVIYEVSKDEEIKRLTDENKNLLLQIAQIQADLIQTQKALAAEKDNVKLLQADKIALLEAAHEQEKAMWIAPAKTAENDKKSFWKRFFG